MKKKVIAGLCATILTETDLYDEDLVRNLIGYACRGSWTIRNVGRGGCCTLYLIVVNGEWKWYNQIHKKCRLKEDSNGS